MTTPGRRIAFKVEFSRILELLSDQIYQSPLALLRENTQNAFDAIRMREAHGDDFMPEIHVTVDTNSVVVSDNGVGMTAEEIERNFWYAGNSSKNTEMARAAGVVGTFGIGAMANFGIAEELSVDSQSAITGERTLSSVRKSELSTETEGISLSSASPRNEPGTTVRARLANAVTVPVAEARKYLQDFVEFVDVPVFFNEEKLSGAIHRDTLPSERSAWHESHSNISLAGILSADLEVFGLASGELRLVLEQVKSSEGLARPGSVVLLQGRNAIRTLRSGFGLATIAMQSVYHWGGVADLPFLKPTAGREALDAKSNQFMQSIITAVDQVVSPIAARHPESFANDGFLQWIVSTKQFNLCGPLEVMPRPSGESVKLDSVVERSGVRFYSGHDESVIQTYASLDEPLIVLSRRAPRRTCELGYLNVKNIKEIDTTPRVTSSLPLTSLSFAHSALATRIARILEEDYFLAANVHFGKISGDLSLLVTDARPPVQMYLDPDSTSVSPLLALYRDDYNAFGPFVKDFVRSTVFSRVAKLVPSSTREGAEAFLRHLHANRELFEYEIDDKADIEEILEKLHAGKMTVSEATKRLTDTHHSILEVSRTGTAPLSSVVREMEQESTEDDAIDSPFDPRPGIDRREQQTSARILTSETPVNGYKCFLSISDRVQREKGDFFLQPHSTEVVWGGRKVIFVFHHHSGEFGLYYDILCPGLVGTESGGGPRVTSTILAKDRTFIPIPDEIAETFLPRATERKRLEIRCDILYLEGQDDIPATTTPPPPAPPPPAPASH